MELKIEELRKICVPENIEITLHAAKRLEQRNISIPESNEPSLRCKLDVPSACCGVVD